VANIHTFKEESNWNSLTLLAKHWPMYRSLTLATSKPKVNTFSQSDIFALRNINYI